jgi:hypothetical protein
VGAQDVVVRIVDRNGDATTTRRSVITNVTDTRSVTHQSFSLAADAKTDVDLGGVTTASTIYIERTSGTGTIQVYQGNSNESWLMDDLFFVMGTAVTQLSLEASSAQVVWIYIAGS